ncbi:MAG: twin-arginine translocase subunit TatC [Crocinitomicaceae bacterium]|nr:twin-arginine translocase subunit TatC [Crocinitomicaceae bacterium]
MEEQGDRMPFLAHLEELRWRLMKAVIAILVCAIVIFIFTETLTQVLFLNMAETDFPIFRFFCWAFNICVDKIAIDFQSIELTGQFTTNLMMSILGGVIVAFPFIFYQIWAFVKPGLKDREKKMAKGIVFYVSLLFFVGVSFGYWIVAPLSVQFFGNWKMVDAISNTITINSYLKTITNTVFLTGIFFLLPIIIYMFSKLGIVTAAFLKKFRKHAYVGVLILAAVITPPDIFTQLVVTLPIVGLYEVGIFIAKRIEKQRYQDSLT